MMAGQKFGSLQRGLSNETRRPDRSQELSQDLNKNMTQVPLMQPSKLVRSQLKLMER